MAGTIDADQPKCKCGGTWKKMKMGKYEVPVCSVCGENPDKLRIRRVLPAAFGQNAKRIEIRYDMNNERLTDVGDAIGTMKQIDKEITDGTFDPKRYGSREVALQLQFSHFVENKYLPIQENKMKEGEISPSTYKIKKGAFKNHLGPYFKNMDLRDISGPKILDFYNSFKANTPRQKNLVTAELRVILELAYDYELIPKVPKFPKLKKANFKNPDTFYSAEQQLEVISRIKNPTYKAAIKLLAKYGMRPCEVRALHESDVNLFQDRLEINYHFSASNMRLPGRKSNGDSHYLYLDDEAKEIIAPFLTGNPNAPLFKGESATWKRGGSGYIAERVLSRAWADAVGETDLPYIDLYTGTKSSTLSGLLAEGHSHEEIKNLSGHTNIETLKRYAQLTQEQKLEGQKNLLSFKKKKEG